MAGEWRNDVFIDGLFTFAIASLFVILALLIVAVHELCLQATGEEKVVQMRKCRARMLAVVVVGSLGTT